jgi:hypothetical protein
MNSTTYTFTTHANPDISELSFSCSVEASYDDLVTAFGAPTPMPNGDKRDVMWTLKYSDDKVATIYNWKDGPSFLGVQGMNVQSIKQWNIGELSRAESVVDRIKLSIALAHEANESAKEDNDRPKIEKALESAEQIMDNIKATRGVNYARMVEIGMLVRKASELNGILLHGLVMKGAINEKAASVADQAMGTMLARMMALSARITFGSDEAGQKEAPEVLQWVTRMIQTEQDAVKPFMDEVLKKQNGED